MSRINHNLMQASDRGQKPVYMPRFTESPQATSNASSLNHAWTQRMSVMSLVWNDPHLCETWNPHNNPGICSETFQAFGIYSLHSGLSQFRPPQGFLGMPLCLCTVFRINLNIWQKRKVTSDTCLGKKMFQTTSLEWNLNVLYNYKENKVFLVGLSTCM